MPATKCIRFPFGAPSHFSLLSTGCKLGATCLPSCLPPCCLTLAYLGRRRYTARPLLYRWQYQKLLYFLYKGLYSDVALSRCIAPIQRCIVYSYTALYSIQPIHPPSAPQTFLAPQAAKKLSVRLNTCLNTSFLVSTPADQHLSPRLNTWLLNAESCLTSEPQALAASAASRSKKYRF